MTPNAKVSFADVPTQLISSVTCGYHIDKLNPRRSPFGLLIRTVIDHSYMQLREPQEHLARPVWLLEGI